MRRRVFVMLTAATVCAGWPHAVHPQHPMPVIGFMSSRSAEDSRDLVTAFRQGLAESGLIESQGVTIDYRWAQGRYERLDSIARDFVARRVAVIVAVGGVPSAVAAKGATASIPVVFSVGSDPVTLGLVASFSRPQSNATGISLLGSDLAAKRLALLRELAPKAAVVGVLINRNNPPSAAQALAIEQEARRADQRVRVLTAGTDEELEKVFAAVDADPPEALLVAPDPYFATQRDRIVGFAARRRLPAMYQSREYAAAGGLASYGVALADAYRQVGRYAARLLKGEKPADLPVVQPTRLELVINMRAARTLGLHVSPALLARADEILK
jgi:putative ABC transport system substrate-binding protein